MSEAGSYLDPRGSPAHNGAAHPEGWTRDLLARHRHLIRLFLVVSAGLVDVAALLTAAMIGAAIRQGDLNSGNWVQTFGVLAPTYLLAALTFGAYSLRPRPLGRALMPALGALVIAAAFGLCAAFALQVGAQFSRLETGFTLVAAMGLLLLVRMVGAKLTHAPLHAALQPIVVVLTDGTAPAHCTGAAVRYIDIRAADLRASVADPSFFDRLAGLARDADRVVIALADIEERRQWACAMRLSGLDAEMVTDFGDVHPVIVSNWHGRPTLVISRGPLRLGERLAKRAFDLAITVTLLPILGPVIALCAVLVKLETPGPAFFVQDRVGRNSRTYRCFKLRTMRTELGDAQGVVSAAREDRRVTPLGKFLRRSSIDELPQLINVLIGDMSLVGPRPHALGSRAEGALFWELVPNYWSRHSMKPGVTGLAQVRGLRGATQLRSDIESRVATDLEYINGWSLWLDIKILLRTLTVLTHRNAY